MTNLIAKRITDLLIIAGFTDKHTIEELTDHYLTHIEEEVKRGLNSQQAIRETFQEIANIDIAQFKKQKKKRNWKLILWVIIILMGLGGILQSSISKVESNSTKTENKISSTENDVKVDPPSGLPLDESLFDISSNFGLRMHPILKETKMHTGIDLKAKTGTPVYATADGTIKEASFKKLPGKYVVIQHDGGFKTKYFHLSDIKVKPGMEVRKGQQIGNVGNSGKSFKPHLHYEVLKDDVPVNPKDYIKP